jgi:radical SAM superfamily enzyme YgiQ (UPF0313 family)
MSDIVLTTLNAKYFHSSFGLRYLLANMGDLKDSTFMMEFTILQHPIEILDLILKQQPKLVGIGVYIWNIDQVTQLVAALKKIHPEIVVVLGGPEVSYEQAELPVVQDADYVITGEADLSFPDLCRQVLSGDPPGNKIIVSGSPSLEQVRFPYHLYDEHDIANRVIYVEASRGCPFTCQFCLSALEIPVRQFPLELFLDEMQSLLDRGVTQFKFVDRTFNLNLKISRSILEFFLARYQPGMFFHFEMIPDRLPESLRELIAKFPDGALQFEVGIQTFNLHVSELIARKQDYNKLEENLRFLKEETGVHVHTDLIFGLPGETWESFREGFDQLIQMAPQEIQVGMLKRLRGTPISCHDDEWEMKYSPYAPYEILQNKLLDFEEISRLRRFARYWDLVGNSGNFIETLPMLWNHDSPFKQFMEFSDWLFSSKNKMHGISLIELSESLFQFITRKNLSEAQSVAEIIYRDYQRGGRHDKPHFLRPYISSQKKAKPVEQGIPKRQKRHLEISD